MSPLTSTVSATALLGPAPVPALSRAAAPHPTVRASASPAISQPFFTSGTMPQIESAHKGWRAIDGLRFRCRRSASTDRCGHLRRELAGHALGVTRRADLRKQTVRFAELAFVFRSVAVLVGEFGELDMDRGLI